jgi:hypothetical protein
MKITLIAGLTMILSVSVLAQDAPGGKTLASTMEVYVFPNEGQDASQQSKDESECYNFATTNTGNDPFALVKQADADAAQAEAEMAAAEQTGKGAGARGAVRGAAAGAVIGEVTGGDAGESAAIGAAAVGIRSRRKGREAEAQATAQAESQAGQRQEATAGDLENFKKAFSVCLEAKEYMVKY